MSNRGILALRRDAVVPLALLIAHMALSDSALGVLIDPGPKGATVPGPPTVVDTSGTGVTLTGWALDLFTNVPNVYADPGAGNLPTLRPQPLGNDGMPTMLDFYSTSLDLANPHFRIVGMDGDPFTIQTIQNGTPIAQHGIDVKCAGLMFGFLEPGDTSHNDANDNVGNFRILRGDFDVPQMEVSLTFLADFRQSQGFLVAFDENGDLVDAKFTSDLGIISAFETDPTISRSDWLEKLTVTSATANIKFVAAGAINNRTVFMDLFEFGGAEQPQVVPEPGSVAIWTLLVGLGGIGVLRRRAPVRRDPGGG